MTSAETRSNGTNGLDSAVLAILLGLLIAIGVSVASWWHQDLTTNDFERFDDLRLTYIFFSLLAGGAAGYIGLVGQARAATRRQVWIGLFAMAVPLVFAFPVGSRDIFAYAFYPKMWAVYGANPYLQAPSSVASDSWFPMLQAWWKDHTTTYGPLFTLQARVLYAIARNSLAAVVAAHKLTNLGLLLLSGWLLVELRRAIANIGEDEAVDRALELWLWCPLVLFESLVSAHNDLAMTVLVQAAILAWVRSRWATSGALLAASFWFKLYSVLLLPVLLMWWLRRSRSVMARQLAIATTAALLVSLAALAPFYGSLAEMFENLRGHEVARLVFPSEMPPLVWLAFRALLAAGALDSESGIAFFTALRVATFAAALLWLIWRRRNQPYCAALLVDDCFLSLALFVCIVPTVLYPWHLLVLCPLALAVGGRGHERAVALISTVGLLSYFLTFVWATALCGLVVGTLWVMRRNRP